jgi:hypothetical protein
MLAIVPERVVFAGGELKGVRVVAVSRIAVRAVSEYSEEGPHCVFADAPEQRTRVTVITPLGGDDSNPPTMASSGVLEVRLARSPATVSRKEIRMLAVVTQVSYRATSAGADRTVEFEALSADGRTDPVTIVELD